MLTAVLTGAMLLAGCGHGPSLFADPAGPALPKEVAAARTAASRHDYAHALADVAAIETATRTLAAEHKIDGARAMRIIAASEAVGHALLAVMPQPPATSAPTVPSTSPPPHGHGHHGGHGDNQND
jgi:hypothetical protein